MGWPQNAYVGQKVVSLHTFSPRPIYGLNDLPQKDEIYTISKIVISPSNEVGLFFKELQTFHLYGYMATVFRPLQSTDKGMEVLKGLLNPINHKVLEDA